MVDLVSQNGDQEQVISFLIPGRLSIGMCKKRGPFTLYLNQRLLHEEFILDSVILSKRCPFIELMGE